MNPALLVLNPRHINECVQAIKALDIPTCWISYMREPAAADAINSVIAATTDYTHYTILSDDTTPTQAALDAVLTIARNCPDPVTGYCNLDEGDYADIVNLTTNRLPPPPSRTQSYQFLTRQQVDTHPARALPTTFAGLALTTLPRELALRYPLRTDPTTGGQMDYDLSYRLAQDSIPIWAARDGYVHHVKERWSHGDQIPRKRLLIGERNPAVTWTNVPTPANTAGR
jgi:hypothetical protein